MLTVAAAMRCSLLERAAILFFGFDGEYPPSPTLRDAVEGEADAIVGREFVLSGQVDLVTCHSPLLTTAFVECLRTTCLWTI